MNGGEAKGEKGWRAGALSRLEVCGKLEGVL